VAPRSAAPAKVFDVDAAVRGAVEKTRNVSVIYSARGISKRFGAVPALQGVDFDVVEGKVNGLVGANGAGKSTLLKIIAGALAPDAGEIKLDGRPLALSSITDAARAGIAIVSQELSLFPALSVEENLLLAPGKGAWHARRAYGRNARAILRRLGVDVALNTPLYQLSLADRQLVEIARAMLQNPRVLILDEPTSSLHVAEVERLHDIIRGLRESGIGIVYVSHFLEELLDISDNLVILRNGKRVAEDIARGPDQLRAVVTAMLGETPESALERAQRVGEQIRPEDAIPPISVGPLRVAGLKGADGLAIDNLEIAPGAIVGVAGLAGAGVEELFAILFGAAKPKSGRVILPSGAPLPGSTAGAVKAGVAYTPADRKQYGLMLRQSVAENVVSVRALTLGRDGFVLRAERLRQTALNRCRQLGVVAGSMALPVGALSGGNQQKVVFAKWIEAAPSLLVLDDPTRGIDIGAKREMHRIMRRLAQSGRVVLFYSSDPGEIVAVADRVIVFVDGALTQELDGETLTEHALVTAMNTSAKPPVRPAA
jgi:ABC-type sugar transport system ATPase subunit